MGVPANKTVFDGASTPVSHTLVGEESGKDPNGDVTARWREQISALPAEAQVRLTQIKRKLKSGTWMGITRIEVPVMESISGQNAQGYTAPPRVAYTDTYELVSKASPRSTEITKRIAMQMLLNVSNNVATSVTPISAGIVADLHQRLQQAS